MSSEPAPAIAPLAAPAEQLVILTGMSGAGKSTALRTFEDLGYYCIDNLPPTLIETFLNLYSQSGARARGVAIVCDIRSGELFANLRNAIDQMRQHGIEPLVLFFDCAHDELVTRFSATRRVPPLGEGRRPMEALQLEREALEPLKDLATEIIDTTGVKAAQLRDRILGLVAGSMGQGRVAVTLLTFGFKHGVPPDADFVFDTRFLPNPFYIDDLRPLTGNDDPVREYLFAEPLAESYLDSIERTLCLALEHYNDVGKHYAVVALGCTGGRHRSVCLANELARRLGSYEISCTVQHRDVDRE